MEIITAERIAELYRQTIETMTEAEGAALNKWFATMIDRHCASIGFDIRPVVQRVLRDLHTTQNLTLLLQYTAMQNFL